MNAASVWAGHEYATHPNYYGKGPWPERARRFKVVRVEKLRLYGNERLTSFAYGHYLDRDTGQPVSAYETKVRCRDLITHWTEYAAWEQSIIDERNREFREKKERDARLNEKALAVKAAIAELGCPNAAITVRYNPSASDPRNQLGPIVIQTTEEVLDWLGLSDNPTDEVVEQIFGSEWEKLDL